jgi:CheY-like chemotaxis protein/HPt (histidine-containing phosphotransfer) domain-containing protein
LSKLGYSVKTADDGRAAIDEIFAAQGAGEPYQLVWMDVHMPNMDGYEATKVLRDPKSGCAQLRIVAMTAAAMEGDRETCIEAGMDDYVSKPLQHRDLVAALERAIASGAFPVAAAPAIAATNSVVEVLPDATKAATAAVIKADASSPSVVNHFDAERLDELAEYDEDGSLVSDLADVFCRQAPEMVASISAANAAGDIEALIGAAHQLKGAASNIGVTAVFNAADLIELQGRHGGLPAIQADADVQAALQNLPENLNAAMHAVREYAKAVRARAAANAQSGGIKD